jgi:hypothetical protein
MTAADLREIENAFSKLDIRGLFLKRWSSDRPLGTRDAGSGPQPSKDLPSAGRAKPGHFTTRLGYLEQRSTDM